MRGTHSDQLSSTNQLSGRLISPQKKLCVRGYGKRCGEQAKVDGESCAVLVPADTFLNLWGVPRMAQEGWALLLHVVQKGVQGIPREDKLKAAGARSPFLKGLCPWSQTTKQGTNSRRQESSIRNHLEVVTDRTSFNCKTAARIQGH